MTKQTERIQMLKDILLRLHNGASPESVQDDFNAHFTGVSAIEISLMEHELMNGDHGISFEDVMKLCNVHANLFKGAIEGVTQSDADKSGHPVSIFKQENMAFQATLHRIHRLLAAIQAGDTAQGLLDGLKRQYELLHQFTCHYNRKEQLFFPIMERYGHDAPPKVMWGVDDEIRQLFTQAYHLMCQLPAIEITRIQSAFNVFEQAFKDMIFKEEAILLPLVLSIFNEDDWYAIARESDDYGYAIITPEEKWQPERHTFVETASQQEITTSFSNDTTTDLPFGGGYLTLKEANLILNHLPFEITFIDEHDIFKYFNQSLLVEEKLFPRTTSAIGRDVRNCHPPKSLDMVLQLIDDLKHKRRKSESMWFPMRGKYVYVTYIGVFDEADHYMGVLEYVHDIQPLQTLGEAKRGLSDLPS